MSKSLLETYGEYLDLIWLLRADYFAPCFDYWRSTFKEYQATGHPFRHLTTTNAHLIRATRCAGPVNITCPICGGPKLEAKTSEESVEKALETGEQVETTSLIDAILGDSEDQSDANGELV